MEHTELIEELKTAARPLFEEKRYAAYTAARSEESFYREDLLRVLLLGRFKAGKSSLINVMTGKDVAAVDALEKTAWIARYWPAREEFCNVFFKDGTCETIETSEFLKKTSNDEWGDEVLSGIRRIDVGYTGDLADFGIIDTPGFGSSNEDNEKRAMEAIKDADIVIYLADINKLGNQRETAIISSIRDIGVPMICVANKYDGDVAHHKTEDEALDMVSKYTGFDRSDIYLMSVKAYNRGRENAVKYLDAIMQRIHSAGVMNEELRLAAREANRRRVAQEEMKLLLQAKCELLTIRKARVRLEDNYVYNQNMIDTELQSYVKEHVQNSLYDGYRDEIKASMEAETSDAASENRKPDYTSCIQKVLPDGYMDRYWDQVRDEICRKCKEMWTSRESEESDGEDTIVADLRRAGINLSFDTEGLHGFEDPSYDAELSGKIVNSTFKAAGFATFCSIALGATLGGALMLGAPIVLFGMWLAGAVKGKKETQSVDDILNTAINRFADMISKYAVKGLTENEGAILDKRLEMFDKEASSRLPAGVSMSDTDGRLDRAISELSGSIEETSDIALMRMAADRTTKEIERIEKNTNDLKSKKNRSSVDTGDGSASGMSEALSRLDGMIGLDQVKENVRSLITAARMQSKKAEAGISATVKTRHLIFTGNPGTGKTEVARLLGQIYREIGILKKGQFVEASRVDLVGKYTGHTAVLTQQKCREALGGILFIDEAYSLSGRGEEDFGREAIDTLLKFMEDNRDDIVVIVAGYRKQMRGFLDSNPGLESRFSECIDFPDYKPRELTQIFRKFCTDNRYSIDADALEAVEKYMVKIYESRDENFANARTVRNYFEHVVAGQEARLMGSGESSAEELRRIKIEDLGLDEEQSDDEQTDYLEKLDSMIGLKEVKDQVREMINGVRIGKLREEQGIHDNAISRHMVFTGNPGTGKTEVARLIAGIYHQMGIVATDRFVEADRSTLVAGYIGQTAAKTLQVCREAAGGVLFIDEAYTLSGRGDQDFGQEAIDTLLKYMEDNRDRILVIVAGYTENMDEFLSSNPGLRSRFQTFINFPDYSVDELIQIFMKFCLDNSYVATEECLDRVRSVITSIYDNRSDHFANAREVRNLFETVVRHQKNRIAESGKTEYTDLITLTEEDVIK